MTEEKAPVQYVLVRKDLPVYVQMVNVGHACGEAIVTAPISKRTIIRLLHVENEQELCAIHDVLKEKKFNVEIVRETSGPFAEQYMALATEPMTERISAIGKVFWYLKRADE